MAYLVSCSGDYGSTPASGQDVFPDRDFHGHLMMYFEKLPRMGNFLCGAHLHSWWLPLLSLIHKNITTFEPQKAI